MKSTSPTTTKQIAMAPDRAMAQRGSPAPPNPLASNRFSAGKGRTRSWPSAWRVRGATRIDPSAEDRVAAASPIKTAGPQTATRAMTNWSAWSSSGFTLTASLMATTT